MNARLRRLCVVAAMTAAFVAGCAPDNTRVAMPSPFPNAPPPQWAQGADRATTNAAMPLSPVFAADVVGTALGLRGVPYRLGGDDPARGMDCSGLVQYVFAEHAVDLPRTVAEQFRVGRRVNAHQAEAGDLVFFETTGSGPSHVGIALGPTTFVHAPGSGHVVRVEAFDTPYWSPRLLAVKRVLPTSN